MTNKDLFDEAFPDGRQVGGSHYKKFVIQPWTFIRKNNLKEHNFCMYQLNKASFSVV